MTKIAPNHAHPCNKQRSGAQSQRIPTNASGLLGAAGSTRNAVPNVDLHGLTMTLSGELGAAWDATMPRDDLAGHRAAA
jgi:hypothetical protein